MNGGLNLKEACELILAVNGEATRIEWSEVVKRFKSWLTKSGYIGQPTWEGNYKKTLDRVLEDLAGEKQPASVAEKGFWRDCNTTNSVSYLPRAQEEGEGE